jgi:hypothetical protein
MGDTVLNLTARSPFSRPFPRRCRDQDWQPVIVRGIEFI